MSNIKQIHHPDFSLWQSAIDQTVAKSKIGGQTEDMGIHKAAQQRPDSSDPMVAATAHAATDLEQGATTVDTPVAPRATEGLEDWGKYCSSIWWQIAKAKAAGNAQAEANWQAQLGPFTTCDTRYKEAAEQYVEFYKLKHGTAPYKVWQNIGDFVIDWKIPAQATIAIVGDWGTGQQPAKDLLGAIARKKPDIVIHLGDVYYSGTEFEMENYFLNIWNATLGPTGAKTFSLAGNHDMYSGGGPYYKMIASLGQPASYFCLRNDDWQFIALDTGLHDADALDAKPTYLEDTEVEWLKDKVATANGRKTVLLSHHQLYTAFDDIGGSYLNSKLKDQVGPVLPDVAVWFWGHEHNQVIYKAAEGVLGRCVGHGAYPVGLMEIPSKPKYSNVELENVALARGASFYSHGYAIMKLDGASARVSYYQDSDDQDTAMYSETFGAAGAGR